MVQRVGDRLGPIGHRERKRQRARGRRHAPRALFAVIFPRALARGGQICWPHSTRRLGTSPKSRRISPAPCGRVRTGRPAPARTVTRWMNLGAFGYALTVQPQQGQTGRRQRNVHAEDAVGSSPNASSGIALVVVAPPLPHVAQEDSVVTSATVRHAQHRFARPTPRNFDRLPGDAVPRPRDGNSAMMRQRCFVRPR